MKPVAHPTEIALPPAARTLLLAAIAAGFPLMAAVFGWYGLEQTLYAELRTQSVTAMRMVARNPAYWDMAAERMQFALQEHHDARRQLTLTTMDGRVLVGIGDKPAWPATHLTTDIRSGDAVVARLDIATSLRPVLKNTAIAGLAGLLLTLAVAVPLLRRLEQRIRSLAARLNASERRYEHLFHQSHEGIAVVAPETRRFVDFNRKAHEQLGYTAAEFGSLRVDDISVDEDRAAIRRHMQEVIERGWDDFETRLRCKDGSLADINVSVQTLLLDGKPVFLGIFRDIGERKRAEARLREAHSLLRTVLDTIPIRVFWKDREDRYLGANELFLHDARLAALQDLVGRRDDELVWSADAAAYQADDRQVMETGKPKLGYIETQSRPDGSRVWLRTWKVPLRDTDGGVVGVLGVYDDITLLKEAEEKLHNRENLLQAVFSQAHDAIEISDMETLRYIEFNDAAPRMLGYTREEYARLSTTDVEMRASHEDALRLGERLDPGDSFQFVTRHRRKDGSQIDVQASVAVIEHLGRKYWMAAWTDITETLRAQRDLTNQVAFTDAIINAEVDGIAVCKGIPEPPHVRFSVWNPAMILLTGYDMDEINRDGWHLTVHGDQATRESARARMQQMLAGNHLLGEEWEIVRRDGQIRTVEIYSHAIGGPDGDAVLAVLRDITERKRNETEIQRMADDLELRVLERTRELHAKESELRALNETLARLVEAKVEELRQKDAVLVEQSRHAAMGEMIGNIAHQWRQPLSALGLVIQNLRYDFKDEGLDDAALDAYVNKAMRLIDLMTTTIDDFRNFFKPERRRERFNLAQSVRDCHDLVGAALAAHGIGWHFDDTADIWTYGYRGEFSQVVLNLIGNARDAVTEHRPNGGWIAVSLARAGDEAVLAVEDNGGGIAEEHLEKIYDPYFTTKSTGTGVGLYMSRTIVEQHMNGSIAAQNTGSGARFVVRLPILEVPERAGGDPRAS